MGLIDNIKSEIKNSGTNKGKIMFIREGEKKRVRFLNDMEDGMEVTFHDSFAKSILVPCQEHFGKSCPYCEMEGLRTRSQFIWSVYDYDAKEVKLFMFAVNNCSPIPSLLALYDEYGTIIDRDFIISVNGKQQNKSFTVIPGDKVKFRNPKAKPFSESKILEILNKAYPCDEAEEEEDEEEPKPKKKSKSSKPKKVKEPEPEEDDYDEEEGGEEETDYSEMTPKELYHLCKEKGIEAIPKKKQKYYIDLLEEYNRQEDDWSDDEDDEWEDEE